MKRIKQSRLLLGAALVALVIGMTFSGTAQVTQDDSENGTINVEVASQTAVDISPADLSFTGTNAPEPGETVNESDSNYTAVEVENIGSNNISHVWLNSSTPSQSPFGEGDPSLYDAGNWIQVNATNEITGVAGPDEGFTYINRKDYNETNDLSYVFTPEDTRWDYGRFRAGDQEFFWAVNVSTSGTCDGSSGESPVIRVAIDSHNKTHTGDADFTDGGDGDRYWEYPITGPYNGQGLATGVNYTMPSGNVREYDVLTSCSGSDTYTLRGKYNPYMGGANDLTFDSDKIQYMMNATGDSNAAQLQPGEHFRIDTQIEVPFGVPSTGQTSGTLRVMASQS